MRCTGLAIAAYLVTFVSAAVVFRNAGSPPSRKRQGFLEGFLPVDTETTGTPVHLPTTTSFGIPTVLVPLDSTTSTKALFPDLGGLLFPPNASPTTSASSSSLSTVSPTSTSSPSRTHTSSSSAEPAVVFPVPPGTPTFSSSVRLTSSDTPSLKPTEIPPPTLTAAPASAASANSMWKTAGISVSVVTLVGLTILLVVFYEQWTAFVRDVFLCRRSRRDQDPLGDEDFLPDKHYENYDATIRSYNRKWAREIRESARLSNIRYPTGVFYGDGSILGPGKAGVGAGGRCSGAGEFGQLDRPSRPSFLQRLSMLSLHVPPPVSPRPGTKSHSPGIGKTGDGFPTFTSPSPRVSTF